MPHVAVTAFGADRPGIVAAATKVFVDRGCNIEDTSMTILRGHFAMMLVVDAPAGLTPGELERALAEPAGELDLVVAVRALDDEVPVSPPGDTWTVSVYGVDRPGIVHRISGLLADQTVNIVDLTTRVIGDAARPAYAMLLEVTVPPELDVEELGGRLRDLARSLGVECTLHPSDADIL
ncbi:MAG: ACT domain-containing protein [Actinobacteria bacterium]|nr:MAG: ACT domain-containing protein [Actinomycetota bacterium]